MFKYINSFNNIVHNIIENNEMNFNVAIDATLGNGHDTDFLSTKFSKVYSFDIQEQAVLKYREKNIQNVNAIFDTHENFKLYIKESVDCIVYNLGYLPGADKTITTNKTSTINSILTGLDLLNKNGLMFIMMYPGHEEGRLEKDYIIKLAKELPTKHYGVLLQEFINRPNNPPCLLIIEKK